MNLSDKDKIRLFSALERISKQNRQLLSAHRRVMNFMSATKEAQSLQIKADQEITRAIQALADAIRLESARPPRQRAKLVEIKGRQRKRQNGEDNSKAMHASEGDST